MNVFFAKLLYDGIENDGKIIKNLIDTKILDYDMVINSTIKAKNPRIIYDIAKNIAKEKDILKLATAICETNNAMFIYYFARDIKGAPIDILAEAISKTNDTMYITHFLLEIVINNKELQEYLVDVLINLNAIYVLREIRNSYLKNDIDILNKIKCYLLKNEEKSTQYQSLIESAEKDEFEELKIYAEIYRELLGIDTEKEKSKKRELKPE